MRTRGPRRWVALSIALCVASPFIWVIVGCPLAKALRGEVLAFDRNEWLARDPTGFTACMCDRRAMAVDLVNRDALVGLARSQLVELLGEGLRGFPDSPDDGTRAYFLSYELDDQEWLHVQFDPDDRVCAARLASRASAPVVSRRDRSAAVSYARAMLSSTPKPPYYAVIFTSTRTSEDRGYSAMAGEMVRLAAEQPGFLGVESAREDVGITVSYWRDLDSIRAWKAHARHQIAQRLGREMWYAGFRLRVALVEREEAFDL